jgi:hypothetical protein
MGGGGYGGGGGGYGQNPMLQRMMAATYGEYEDEDDF